MSVRFYNFYKKLLLILILLTNSRLIFSACSDGFGNKAHVEFTAGLDSKNNVFFINGIKSMGTHLNYLDHAGIARGEIIQIVFYSEGVVNLLGTYEISHSPNRGPRAILKTLEHRNNSNLVDSIAFPSKVIPGKDNKIEISLLTQDSHTFTVPLLISEEFISSYLLFLSGSDYQSKSLELWQKEWPQLTYEMFYTTAERSLVKLLNQKFQKQDTSMPQARSKKRKVPRWMLPFAGISLVAHAWQFWTNHHLNPATSELKNAAQVQIEALQQQVNQLKEVYIKKDGALELLEVEVTSDGNIIFHSSDSSRVYRWEEIREIYTQGGEVLRLAPRLGGKK